MPWATEFFAAQWYQQGHNKCFLAFNQKLQTLPRWWSLAEPSPVCPSATRAQKCKIHFPFWRLQKLKRKQSLASKFLLIDTKSHWLSSNFCRLLAKRSWVCLCAFHQKGFASISWFTLKSSQCASMIMWSWRSVKRGFCKISAASPNSSWNILKPFNWCQGNVHMNGNTFSKIPSKL